MIRFDVPVRYRAAVVASLWLLAGACGDSPDNRRYSSPAATYKTYRNAVEKNDAVAAWDCLAASYRKADFEGDLQGWKDNWPEQRPSLEKDLARREIVEEREINNRIAYLLFDVDIGKGESPTSPYFYFLREDDPSNKGWKITSYLDSTFHQELERAIASGEYSVPR